MSKELLAEVERGIDEIDQLNKATDVDLMPHAAALDRLRTSVAGYYDDLREQFDPETEGANAGDFLEALQNLFEMYLGDNLFEEINRECPAAESDSALASRINSELMRHVARIALKS